MMANRYLSESGKSEELSYWRGLLDQGGAGGPGSPDRGMIPWCDRINAIDGICTLQSCSGHDDRENGIRSAGHLWLWLSAQKSSAFKKRAFELAQNATIERISTIYQPWGREVVQIEFRGAPEGQLESSGQTILAFLTSL